jgi:hypothetical protein
MATPASKIHPLKWVYISGAAFLVALAGAVALIAFAGRLSFIPNSLYFVILIPLGLAAAGFLFGAMRSHAKFSGQTSYGTLELAGPVVVFGLVVLGGLFLANPTTTFALTVRVFGPGGQADIIRQGTVTADLGPRRDTRPINEQGEVVFADIPTALAGHPIRLLPDVPGYRLRDADAVVIPENHIIELELQRPEESTKVRGVIFDSKNRTVSNATISFNGGAVTATTDELGSFSADLPMSVGQVVPITVTLNGRIVYDDNITVAETPALRIKIKNALQ